MKPSNVSPGKARAVSAISIAVAVLFGSGGAYAGSLPTGGHFYAGTGSIGGNGTALTINQSSPRGVINWDSFSIAFGHRVDFNNGTGATLNRVVGGDLSMILGSLSGTGSVYLINPQGIVVGPSGIVTTGRRFVASTLDADNIAFMNGGPLTLSALPGNSNKSVINFGRIGSSGGDIFLVSSKGVNNLGTISAPNGSAQLATGNQVLLQDASSGRQVFVQVGSGGTLFNQGLIKAAQIDLQAADGNIYAMGGNHSAIRANGTATRDGHVWLVADSGLVQMGGTFSAHNADGSGGAVDTVAGTFSPSPYGPMTVSAGNWNLTTPSLMVTSPIAAAMANSLGAGTSVNVNATKGDIEVATNLGWTSSAALNLAAYGSVTVDLGATIKNQGAGNLTLRADATAIDNQGSVFNYGTLDWSNSTGIVSALHDMNGSYAPGAWLSNAAWTPAQGSGLTTQITGYGLVNSMTDLANVSQNLAGNYALGKDIEGGGATVTPLGTHATPFSGQFDGMDHTIDNIAIQPVAAADGSVAPSGLFGVIDTTGVVRNLNLTNSTLSYPSMTQTQSQAGLLAGINRGHIANVFASGTASFAQYVSIGGLVGENDGLIERAGTNVYVGVLTAGNEAGLVGVNNGTIAQSYSTGAVGFGMRPTGPGGLVSINNGTIDQSFVTGAIQSDFLTDPNPPVFGGGNVSADSYWNVQTTGQTNGGGAPAANGLTTAQMSNPASFVGWDFGPNGAWAMPAGWSHPVLRWQLSAGSLPPQ